MLQNFFPNDVLDCEVTLMVKELNVKLQIFKWFLTNAQIKNNANIPPKI